MTIAGNDPNLTVTADDDALHPPTSSDPTWIETAWFPFWLPDNGTSISARVWFRANDGVQGGAVSAWKGHSQHLAHDGWTEEFEPDTDLRHLHLGNGFRLECTEPSPATTQPPQRAHRPRRRLRGVMEPNPVPPEDHRGCSPGTSSSRAG